MTMGLVSPRSTVNASRSVPLSSTKDKLIGNSRIVRTKGWCELRDEIPWCIPSIGKELELETTSTGRIDQLIRVLSSDKTGGDSVDIMVNNRLRNCITTDKYGASLDFILKNCHHRLTILVQHHMWLLK